MSKDCIKYQEDLIDIFYDEKSMDEEIKEHIENCESCSQYWNELRDIKIGLDTFEEKISIDYGGISQAFDIVEERQLKKNNLKSLGIFILLSTLLLGTVLGLVLQGYGREIFYIQIMGYVILPFTLPVIIKFRKLKEGYNE